MFLYFLYVKYILRFLYIHFFNQILNFYMQKYFFFKALIFFLKFFILYFFWWLNFSTFRQNIISENFKFFQFSEGLGLFPTSFTPSTPTLEPIFWCRVWKFTPFMFQIRYFSVYIFFDYFHFFSLNISFFFVYIFFCYVLFRNIFFLLLYVHLYKNFFLL